MPLYCEEENQNTSYNSIHEQLCKIYEHKIVNYLSFSDGVVLGYWTFTLFIIMYYFMTEKYFQTNLKWLIVTSFKKGRQKKPNDGIVWSLRKL